MYEKLINPEFVNLELACEFAHRTHQMIKSKGRQGTYSCSETIVAALLAKKPNWLPAPYADPITAIARLNDGGPEWWHTLLYVKCKGVEAFDV